MEAPKKLTRDEMRKAVAQDVIKCVLARHYIPRTNTGFLFDILEYKDYMTAVPGAMTPNYALRAKKPCGVCVLGAMMLSKIEKFDAVPEEILGSTVGRWEAKMALNDLFDSSETTDIESAFEEGWWFYEKLGDGLLQKPELRILCIMENIVRNGRLDTDQIPNVQWALAEFENAAT